MAARRRGAALLAVAFALAVTGRADVKVGERFPAWESARLAPLSAALPATAGKIVLVDFWASWCAPCKASFPVLARLHLDYAARGVVIVGVSVDEKPAAAAAFVRKLAPPFAAVHDVDGRLVQQVNVPAMPTTYVIGRDGRVRFVHEGFQGDRTERELRRQIEGLLGEKG